VFDGLILIASSTLAMAVLALNLDQLERNAQPGLQLSNGGPGSLCGVRQKRNYILITC
jgi:hypothetical protein